jgi:aryl-alcohol dehydrogenase-like predicted oxidoreductase
MQAREFGSPAVTVSEIGLGCWQLDGICWGDMGEQTALDILHASLDNGVTFFDTADIYGYGRSETLIGRFLKQRSQEVFVATKIGRFPVEDDETNYTEPMFRKHTEASLARLGVETLDLTQLHCIPTEQMRRGDVFDWLRNLRDAGKIKRFGASVESMDEALLCLEQDGLASLQIIFNIFRQKPAGVLFDKARAKGVALIIRLPLASGLLSGKMTKDTTFPENDHRTFNRDGQLFNVGETFAGLPFEKGVELADALKPLVPDGMTMAQMALRWILDHAAVSVVIPGATRVEQAIGNAQVSKLPPLPEELHATLQRFYQSEVADHIRGPY